MKGMLSRLSAPSGAWLVAALITVGILALLAPLAAEETTAPVYRFIIPTVTTCPCDSVIVTVQGEHTESAQGFSLALRYPSADLTIRRVYYEDTILQAISVDYFKVLISPADGTLVVGVLVDAQPPFTGDLIPSIGEPLDFLYLDTSVSPSATGDLHLRFEDGLSIPPINNMFAVNNESVPVTELGEGIISLPGGKHSEVFIRGDTNLDSLVNLVDPITTLSSMFAGTAEIDCVVAADTNDDDSVDLVDCIFVLEYLFAGGEDLAPPHAPGGLDPTPGVLDCRNPLHQQR